MCKVTIAIVVTLLHNMITYFCQCNILFPRMKFGTKERQRGEGGKAIFS